MVPEAPLDRNEHGLAPAGDGWFVLNARDARWVDRGPGGAYTDFEGELEFAQVGFNIVVLAPGQPIAMYHWEDEQEAFLILRGDALLVIEGEERPLRQWDFVHCPPRTNHVIVGAGESGCVVLGVGSRSPEDSGAYTVDAAALRHGAGVEQETTSGAEAYARFPRARPTAYRDDWLD